MFRGDDIVGIVVLYKLQVQPFTDKQIELVPSRPGEFHPEPLTDPDVILSHHPARATARRLPPSVESFKAPPVAGWLAPNVGDLPPSLREHYTRFITSTGQSAPLRRIGTFSLAGSPLVLSPLASPARFSSSVREPK